MRACEHVEDETLASEASHRRSPPTGEATDSRTRSIPSNHAVAAIDLVVIVAFAALRFAAGDVTIRERELGY